MTQFEKGVLDGIGYFIGVVVTVGVCLTMMFGTVGLVVVAWRWMGTVMRGGCP